MAGHTNHAANAAAWAAMRAEQAAQAEQRRVQRAAEREARRAANRAAWAAMNGAAFISASNASDASEQRDRMSEASVSRICGRSVEQPERGVFCLADESRGMWQVERTYTVTVPTGETFSVQSMADAAELITDGIEAAREDAADAASIEAGQTWRHGNVTYTVVGRCKRSAELETSVDGATFRKSYAIRSSDRGQYVRINPNGKGQRDLYAADAA